MHGHGGDALIPRALSIDLSTLIAWSGTIFRPWASQEATMWCIPAQMKGIERMSKIRMTMLVLVGALFVLTGCNTIAGVGQDISGSARAVQHAM